MKNKPNKITIIALTAVVTLSVGIGLSLTKNSNIFTVEGAGSSTIYNYFSNTDSGLATNVALNSNWVLNDVNDGNQSFTFNVGSYTSPNVILGGTSGTALTGTLPTQFVYGNPTLKSLATTANISTIKKLYGFRMNGDVDFTNFQDITVTISWGAGGTGNYSGFIAKSSTGESESWSLLTAGKQAIVPSAAGSISFTDSTNTILMGKSTVRFALIFGGAASKPAMRNISISITGNPRKTLSLIEDGNLDVTRDYHDNEVLNLNIFRFLASYTYPSTTETILGSDARVTFSVDNFANTINKTTYSFSTTGQKTLYYRFVDTTLTAGLNNTATTSMIINIGNRVLTGIEIIDNNVSTLHKYDIYNPDILVYPLYNNASTHNTIDSHFIPDQYTMSLVAGTMFTSSGQYTNTITMSLEFGTIQQSLIVTVSDARDISTPTLSLSNVETIFYLYENFHVGNLLVTADWPVGSDTYPTYSASQEDGTYSISKTLGSQFTVLGNETITITYYVNNTSVSTTYNISVSNYIYTFFNHAFVVGGEWGVSTTPSYGAIVNREGTLTNSITDWDTSTSWILNTTIDSANSDNGAFVETSSDGYLQFIRFGTASAGPSTVQIEGKNFPAITNPENNLNAIMRITIDADAGASGSLLSVSVAGIAPTSYAIDYGTPISGSAALMHVNDYSFYTFYFPYAVIGKIRINFTNASTPGYFDLGNLSVIGYKLSLEKQVETFANMLNHTNTCSDSNFDNLNLVYQYLVSKGVSNNLANYSMTLQPTGEGYDTMSALELWNIYSARSQGGTPQPIAPITAQNLMPSNSILVIILIAIFTPTMIFWYKFSHKNKKKD